MQMAVSLTAIQRGKLHTHAFGKGETTWHRHSDRPGEPGGQNVQQDRTAVAPDQQVAAGHQADQDGAIAVADHADGSQHNRGPSGHCFAAGGQAETTGGSGTIIAGGHFVQIGTIIPC